MKSANSTSRLCALALAALFASGSAMADKPEWAGGGKNDRHERKDQRDGRDDDRRDDRRGDFRDDRRNDRRGDAMEFHFRDDNRRLVNDYYGQQFRSGHCPPGLAKKNNGCMPPGQAKKWRRGYALPHDVRYYDLPRDLVVRLPPPPQGHRYVRVASDILLIAIGSSMVIDAIEDIGR
ncbi:MAG: hypothetical protein BGO63_17955 [Candidatus Accumulibacter sp. 66-26]|nr:RcnB family protein [Accumulibacter sp.]OJW49758.1 MAG: hypothetical protein BGO63_17955 [Candidatus Accumulibacter sp. 66-26]